jgi:bifunctional DNA-binding transcriptional regulator/antitoxin component of YhaV-PrlF toxin-antitoxin module
MKPTVTGKRQVTIPLAMRRIIGIAKKALAGKTVRGWMNELRGPVELPPRRRRR